MPNAKNNAKLTGDTHLPDVGDDSLPDDGTSQEADGTPRGRAQQEEESTAGRGINQAGFIKDKDAQTSNSYGNTRESGEKPR